MTGTGSAASGGAMRRATAHSGWARLRLTTRIAALLILVVTLVAGTAVVHPSAAVAVATGDRTKYARDLRDFSNPERGVYHQNTRCSSAPFTEADFVTYRSDRTTLVRCIFYLNDNPGLAWNPNGHAARMPGYVQAFRQRARSVRDHGMKMILRFAYSETSADAPHDVVLDDLETLTPAIREFSSVIAVLEHGFIGRYGEGSVSDHYGSATDTPARVELLHALLTALPSNRKVLVRTPRMKQALPPASSGYSRVGHFNDCLFANESDGGTWENSPGPALEMEKAWVHQDTELGAMEGETCVYDKHPIPRLTCEPDAGGRTVLTEMDYLNFSALNLDYDRRVLDTWPPSCMAKVKRSLGYRLSLDSFTFPTSVPRGSARAVTLAMTNTGWAAPINTRPVELVLRHAASGATHRLPTLIKASAVRGSQTRTMTSQVRIPTSLPRGRYTILVNLPDADPQLPNRSYAVRLASLRRPPPYFRASTMFEESTGFNDVARTVFVV